ncbi:hypothetical protein KHA93_00480 [Bacillus sp. FJAT-49732]|uniref:Uncharacterized protein n=1 Tax=Lederbergia citrisecunda TaxID=2833583 RepID=A0A942TLH7_9BACI|nr:hypothetical protein [Lederbergia citrisecunda]MBS4198134.1 hypothetical protein [Lederbergia citrisecunda]
MVKKYLSIFCLVIAIIVFLYMFFGHRLGASLYFWDIILFIAALITSFFMPKGKAKNITISLSFICLILFAGYTVWVVNALNHIGTK